MPGLIVKKDVGLLDVDNTLVFQGNADTVIYNDNLLETLKKAGIRDVYLFSSMHLYPSKIADRQKLIDHMQTKGFTVHGVITPNDLFWLADRNLIKEFLDECLNSKTTGKTTKDLLAEDKYAALNDALASRPGIAFAEALAASTEDKIADIREHTTDVCNVVGVVTKSAKIFADMMANETYYVDEKAYMFALFAKYKPDWVNRIVYFDDADVNIDTVKKANENFNLPLIAVLNKDEHKNIQLEMAFYQKALAPLISENLVNLLTDYQKTRRPHRNSGLVHWACSIFKKEPSLEEEDAAITALSKALNEDGERSNLLVHKEVLRHGQLGQAIRAFVKKGAANFLCGKEVSSVNEFIETLHEQINKQVIVLI
ncbi:hypothetical protein [Legionella jamestowniensis]|uniref:Uncharacterized protein n=1 Tax=Legionella jamestowniensis TaxID=455 RepID=A0A0W0UIR6_9GAMM|nr:hypothetical protein [Legionella jamestowniensis]KTD07542.1 hypothetical protein Ljam_1737 [Legionella jamestowniensis]SFM01529.1 hypothetical protein SAMN02746073_3067 [Legionella jamestowniensis DSM 19215]